MEIDLDHFRETFLQEAGEHVAQMVAGLHELAIGDFNMRLLHAVLWKAHSIKGVAATFGLVRITEFTHAMRILLDSMRGGQVQVEKSLIDLLVEAADVLAAMLETARHGRPWPPEAEEMHERLTAARVAGAMAA